jgi:hypothetical protein
VNKAFGRRILSFCQAQLQELREEQTSIERKGRIRYPLMKLLDMYFWQIGYKEDTKALRQ